MKHNAHSRRQFIRQAALASASLSGLSRILHSRTAPAQIAPDASRPSVEWGLQLGDVLADRAIVWSRTDRAARFNVEWSLDERFRRSHVVRGPHALSVT